MKNLRQWIFSALGAALIAVLAQITIPFPLVPNTAQTLGITVVALVLGKKYGTFAVLLYVLLGAVGLPVFAGFSGGIGIVFGNTGGYIIGFPLAAFFIGWTSEILQEKYWLSSLGAAIYLVVIVLGLGTLWLYVYARSWPVALGSGFLPFLITTPLQGVIGTLIGIRLRQALIQAKIL